MVRSGRPAWLGQQRGRADRFRLLWRSSRITIHLAGRGERGACWATKQYMPVSDHKSLQVVASAFASRAEACPAQVGRRSSPALGSPLVSPDFSGCHGAGQSRPAQGSAACEAGGAGGVATFPSAYPAN
jgi:hypothetical protein